MKKISKQYFEENIETMEITEPMEIENEHIIVMPFEQYISMLKILDKEKAEKLEKEIENS